MIPCPQISTLELQLKVHEASRMDLAIRAKQQEEMHRMDLGRWKERVAAREAVSAVQCSVVLGGRAGPSRCALEGLRCLAVGAVL